jgi:hypothetical protein
LTHEQAVRRHDQVHVPRLALAVAKLTVSHSQLLLAALKGRNISARSSALKGRNISAQGKRSGFSREAPPWVPGSRNRQP